MMHRVNQTAQAAQGAGSATHAPVAGGVATGVGASEAPEALPPVPQGGGRLIVDHDGPRTTYTTTAMPPEFLSVAQTAQETAFGLMGLLAAIIILGPFARMIARRMEARPQVAAMNANSQLLQQQLVQLQQSMDAMSIEVERISESQRFQSKLLYEKPHV